MPTGALTSHSALHDQHVCLPRRPPILHRCGCGGGKIGAHHRLRPAVKPRSDIAAGREPCVHALPSHAGQALCRPLAPDGSPPRCPPSAAPCRLMTAKRRGCTRSGRSAARQRAMRLPNAWPMTTAGAPRTASRSLRQCRVPDRVGSGAPADPCFRTMPRGSRQHRTISGSDKVAANRSRSELGRPSPGSSRSVGTATERTTAHVELRCAPTRRVKC